MFTVTRGNNNIAFTFDFTTNNGTAMAGIDYVATAGMLGFAAGCTASAACAAPTLSELRNGAAT